MALPTLSSRWPGRVRTPEVRIARQREQETRWRQQWELHSQYFREQNVRSSMQAHWSSRQSYQQSMAAFHRLHQQEEKKRSLEQRRQRLGLLLQAERDQLEAELRQATPDGSSVASHRLEALCSAREGRRNKVAQALLREHWKQNIPELRQVESELHKEHVVCQWEVQQLEKKQHAEKSQQEQRRFENECERKRQEELERMAHAEEQRKEEEKRRAEELCKQMEELQLREEEATRLKKEQEKLMSQRWELEGLEEERRKLEEQRKKSELRRFLTRQYHVQLQRRAQQVQEELETDRQVLEALLEGEQEAQKLENLRREAAVADAAWMKQVIEEQLKLELEREAEFEILHREEAKKMWEQREAEWDKEKRARERLMHEVLLGRQQQLEKKMLENRLAQEESLRRREELIQELELERQTQRQEREQAERQKTSCEEEARTQLEQRRWAQQEERRRIEQEEKVERDVLRKQEEELQLEMQRMAAHGYQERVSRLLHLLHTRY
uniref:Trichoplein keratin filament-binding protein n=1 Tax=Denticeps clupeoides TaxID=299321 RepID=A0AAY4AZ03_9TELE